MTLTEMANVVLASPIALYHLAAIYVWPMARDASLAVSPFVLVPIAFFWRPHARMKNALSVAMHSATLGEKKDRVSRH